MLKTNNKKVNYKINQYIQDSVKEWQKENIFDDKGEDIPPLDWCCYLIACDVYSAKLEYANCPSIHLILRRYYRNSFYELFKDYMQCLPSLLDASYYIRPAIKILGDILEESKEERAKYTETQAEEMMTRLIFKRLCHYGFIEKLFAIDHVKRVARQ